MDSQRNRKTRVRFTLFTQTFLAACLLWPSESAIASYNVDKVKVFLSANQFIDTLKLTNNSAKPVDIQSQVMSWTQPDGKEVYAPTTDIIVSPPIMKIIPKHTQLMRVGWRAPTALQTEKAYRLFLEEITPNTVLEQNAVRIKLRMGLPVFIAPANPVYQLSYGTPSRSGNTLSISATATGNAHVQIIGSTLSTSDGTVVATSKDTLYLFPKQSTRLTFNFTKPASGSLKLITQTDLLPMQTTINVS